MARTKIVCTLGPACDAPGVIGEMVSAGMDMARVNFSHGDYASHARRIAEVRKAAEAQGRIVAVLFDLQGPKLRLGEIADGSALLTPGENLRLTSRPVAGDAREVHVPHDILFREVQAGQRLLLDDGALELEVTSKGEGALDCRVVTGGRLMPRKGINAPGAALSLPSLTEKDWDDVRFALEQGADYLALSFVRRAADVNDLRARLDEAGSHVPVIAKIEKAEAVRRFEEILAAADAVMVARGDLGVETSAEEVPIYQKQILRACNRAGKPAITATQMLQSMIENPRPTRAEASDVANAVLDGTDAVMLSGETSIGRYPVEAVKMMERVVCMAEEQLDSEEWLRRVGRPGSASEAIAAATVEVAMELKAAAIIPSTISGHSARMVARYRPHVPVLAATPSPETARRMALVWGVAPLLVPAYDTTDEMFSVTSRAALTTGVVRPGDRVVITAGMPAGGEGRTNMLKVHEV